MERRHVEDSFGMSDFTTCENVTVGDCYTGAIADCMIAECSIAETGTAGDCNTEPPTNWNCEG